MFLGNIPFIEVCSSYILSLERGGVSRLNLQINVDFHIGKLEVLVMGLMELGRETTTFQFQSFC